MVRKRGALAKLSPPRLHDVLARTRLFESLDAARQRPVVWLSAQPGAGKTTLIASWLDTRQRPGIWYQLDDADDDPASFIYHLRLAVESLGRHAAPNDLPLLTPEYARDLRGFARRFFRESFERMGADAVLVLDNFQEVADGAPVHVLIAEAMGQLPDSTQIVVLSRSEPPKPYATLLANGAIEVLGASTLQLTLAETTAIAHRRGVTSDAAVQALQQRSQGWAAGLTLLLMRAQRDGEIAITDADSLQHVFSYFAQRVFEAAPPEERFALLQLAVLPFITTDLAAQLTGSPDAGLLLDRYYKRHLFTDRRRVDVAGTSAQSEHVFQFHDLFRTFLQHQSRAVLSTAERRALALRAGRLLQAAGHWEQALGLYSEAEDWIEYAGAIAAHAEMLLGQGRQHSVIEWLGRMPKAGRAHDPWLDYWEGRALMQGAPDKALQVLQNAYRSFVARGDAAGQVASGAAAIQTLWYARLGWSEIAPWVDRLEPLLGEHVVFPSRTIELLTYSAFHAALAFCRVAHPAIRDVGMRLLELVDDVRIDWNQRLSTATHLMTYLHNAAEHDLATQLIGKVDRVVEAQSSSALNRAFWHVFRAIHDVRLARYDEASQRFQRAERLAHDEGLAHAEFAAIQFHAYMDVLFGRAADAEARVARLEVHPARINPDAEMNFHVVRTLLAQLKGDRAAALANAQRALEAIRKVNAEYFQAVYPCLLASVFADAGQIERAREIVAQARAIARGSYLAVMETQLLLEEAYLSLVEGDKEDARARLEQGLRRAAANRTGAAYAHRIVVRKPALLRLALAEGIEATFVRGMIRDWHVAPVETDQADWPWPIKVRTLGEFELRVDDAPLVFGRKTPKKALALLKAVIARGGSAQDGVLIDAFWPDEEGDAAARLLGATVQRLRGLLGAGEAIVQQGRQVALDRARVWVDAWAFERALAAGRIDEALALYRGAFLPEEEGESWPVATRERLRGKFIQAVADHGMRLEAARRDEEAILLYQRGLDADAVVEPFYQGLMRCYHRLDRSAEAANAYRRLKQALHVSLGVPPSAATEKLYQTLQLA